MIDFPESVDTSETDRQTLEVVAGWAARRPDGSVAVEAMRRASLRLPLPSTPEPSQPIPEPELRDKLRRAISSRDAAQAKFETAANAAARADELLALAETELRRLEGIDREIAAYRAAQIREEIGGGASASLELPRELSDRLKAKQEAEARIAAIGSAKAQQLQPALAEARDLLETEQLRVESAVRNLLCVPEARLRQRIDEARSRVKELQSSLAALERFSRVQSPRAHLVKSDLGDPRCVDMWADAFRRLTGDANATLPES